MSVLVSASPGVAQVGLSSPGLLVPAGALVKATGTATVTGRIATVSVTDPRDATASVS